MPFMLAAEALAEETNEAHPHMAGLGHVKTLGKSYSVILISDQEAPVFRGLFEGSVSMSAELRGERLQTMLTTDELAALDQWRFSRHMPSWAAAIRELLRRRRAAEGFDVPDGKTRSADFGVISDIDMVADKTP